MKRITYAPKLPMEISPSGFHYSGKLENSLLPPYGLSGLGGSSYYKLWGQISWSFHQHRLASKETSLPSIMRWYWDWELRLLWRVILPLRSLVQNHRLVGQAKVDVLRHRRSWTLDLFFICWSLIRTKDAHRSHLQAQHPKKFPDIYRQLFIGSFFIGSPWY